MPRRHAMPSISTKSQFDVCGTPSRIGGASRAPARWRVSSGCRPNRRGRAVVGACAHGTPPGWADVRSGADRGVVPLPRLVACRSRLESRLDGAVGGKTAGVLTRAFGMKTVGDLLVHYPRRYAHRGELTPIGSLPLGETVTIVAEVKRVNERRMQQRKGTILEVVISDGNGEMSLTFFGQSWRMKDLRPGRRGVFSGKVGEYRGAHAVHASGLRAVRRRGRGAHERRGLREPADPHLPRDIDGRELAAAEDRRDGARRPRPDRGSRCPTTSAASAGCFAASDADPAHPPARLRRPDRPRTPDAAHARGARAPDRAAAAAAVRARTVRHRATGGARRAARAVRRAACPGSSRPTSRRWGSGSPPTSWAPGR